MIENWALAEAIEYYQGQDAPGNQEALKNLLYEVQEHSGGALPLAALQEIAQKLQVKETFLAAVVKSSPGLRTEEVPHRLELCGGPCCGANGSAALLQFLASAYGVKPGEASKKAGFSCRTCGCMKQCGMGPNIKWDGKVYNKADKALLRRLIENK